jgi:hypothetical protein
MEQVNSHNPDAVFVDGTGIGWGVYDRLTQLGCPNLVGVNFGSKADRTDASDAAARYANKRAEMWGFMKEWCKAGCLPDDRELAADHSAVEYGAHLRLSGRQARLGRGAPLRGRAQEAAAVDPVMPPVMFLSLSAFTGAIWGRG